MHTHTVEHMLAREKNYSKCPLKKRPVNYQFDKPTVETIKTEKDTSPILLKTPIEQPENLSLKKEIKSEDLIPSHPLIATVDEMLLNTSDCCEDEGVDVDHNTDDDEEDDEMIDCVNIEEQDQEHQETTQAAALAAAAAVAAAAVVVPTPTYPKYGLQPWSFHMSPYTAEFYRTINNPHLAQQISPLRGELLSPSSPSDSIGSLSPPPHYLHGRASSVSPPMHAEIIHRPIGVRQLPPQSPQQHQQQQQQQHHHHHHHHHPHQTAQQHRFMPYALHAAYPPHHHPTTMPPYATALPYPHHPHHAPISPAYSDSSYYSMRSLTPESNCSSVPEDLSLKQTTTTMAAAMTTTKTTSTTPQKLGNEKREFLSSTTSSSSSSITSGSSTVPASANLSGKKDKSTPPRYQCPDCQKSYSTFSGLTKHQQFHCPAAEGNQIKKSFSCKDCDKTYVSLGALKMHIRTHTLPCKCNICGKAFSRPWLLQGHIRTHTGEKPFSCQHCHRAFADRSNLRAHLQTHSDIKKYSCTNCSKTFSRMSLLTKHSEGGCPGGSSSSLAISQNPVSDLGESYPPIFAEH